MPSNVIKAKDKWLLTLIRPNSHIKDRSRLQVRIALTQKGILSDSEFIGNFKSSKYGIRIPRLVTNLKKFENKKITIPSTFYSDKDSTRNYYLMDNVLAAMNEGVDKKNQITKNEYFTFTDFQKSPKDVISDARLNGIDFTGKSIIGVMIGAMIGAVIGIAIGKYIMSDTPLRNSENNPNEKESNPTKPSISTKERVFDDKEFRLKLAKSIGHDKIPPLDNTAFDRLKGLFADKIESEYFDAVEFG